VKDLQSVPYNATAEKIVDVLVEKVQNSQRDFFRILVAYYFAKIASNMRIKIDDPTRGKIPINLYAINLATSGQGKGHSTNIIEDEVIEGFRSKFVEETFPTIAENNLVALAAKRAPKNNNSTEVEEVAVKTEFRKAGQFYFSFSEGTSAATKQMRHKLLMADAGAISLEIDEIGSNLMANNDALKVFFELFDMGKVKQKLIKNTNENVHNEEIKGKTPTNMNLFGTPSKLFDGNKVEEEFVSMIEAGMARRCFFAINKKNKHESTLTPAEQYAALTSTNTSNYLIQISKQLEQLASAVNFGQLLTMTADVSILLLEYKQNCEKAANLLPEYQSAQKAELEHRYFKVLKLAGAYAFIDGSPAVEEEHIYNAIRLAEDSGEAFKKLMNRDRNYVKLAKYMAAIDKEVTHADLVEDLPFYTGSQAHKQEMMTLAIAFGYQNNIIIKRNFIDSIEFLRGASLTETDLDKLTLSCSDDIATGYEPHRAAFKSLHKMTQQTGYHWCAHHFDEGQRREDNVIPGFDMVVLDVDDSVSMDTVRLLMDEYTYMMYTTKRHTEKNNRFRLILPMSHRLEMNKEDYTQFMKNIYEWLPFEVDTSTVDRSRKWLSHSGHHEYNDGELLSSLLFIPKTTKNSERQKFVADHQSLNNLERWFVKNTGVGNRSNQMIKYALALVDGGLELADIHDKVLALNNQIASKMDEREIATTIMQTTAKAIATRDAEKA